MNLVTLSATPRLAICPTSAVLPAVRDSFSGFREAGTARHKFLCDIPAMGREEALKRVPDEHRIMCEMLVTDGLPLDADLYRHEIALAYNVNTGDVRLLGYDIGRAYADHDVDPTCEIAGSLDVVGVPRDGWLYVADYKGSHDDTMQPAATNLQLRGGAAMAAKFYRAKCAAVEFIHLKDDGTYYRDQAEMDELDLAAAEEQLREVFFAVKAARESDSRDVTRGPHCRWCPAMASCPATLAMTRSLFAEPEKWGRDTTLITPEMAARAYQAVRDAEKAVKRAKEEIQRYAVLEGIPLPNGRVYGVVQRESVASGRAMPVLMKMFGNEIAMSAAKTSLTTASITEALRPVAKERGVPLAALMREVREALRGEGAYNTKEIVDEYKP